MEALVSSKSLLVLCLTGVVAAAVSQACDSPTDEDLDPEVTSAWLPLVDGAQWRYLSELDFGDSTESRVLELEAVGSEQRNGKEYVRIVEDDSDADLYRIDADSLVHEWARDMPFEIPLLDASADPAASTPVQIEYVDGTDTLRVDGTLAYKGTETVTLSFKTVENCRVFELSGTFESTGSGEWAEGVTTWWWAQGIGYVKRVQEYSPGGVLEETETRTLLYYSIPGGETEGDDGLYTVTGKVVEHDGWGISDIQVAMYLEDNSVPTATTDANGQYTFEDVPIGTQEIRIDEVPNEYWGETLYHYVAVAGDTEAPDLVLARVEDSSGFQLSGLVLTADSVPIADVGIDVTRGPGLREASTDPEGYWDVSLVPEGTWVITPSHDDFTFAPESLVVELDKSSMDLAVTGLDFTGSGGATVTGRLVTPIDLPLEGVAMGFGDFFGAPQLFDTTDATGTYAFEEVPPGSYVLWCATMEYGCEATGAYGLPVEVAGTTTVNVEDIEASKGGVGPYSVSGTFRTSHGQGPLGDDNARVVLYDTLFGTEVSEPPDGFTASFSVGGVHNGTYTVTATSAVYSGITPTSVLVTVDGASVSGIEFTFDAFTVTGQVADTTGAGIGSASVTLHDASGFLLNTTSASNGSFSFTDIANGTYTLDVNKTGYDFGVYTVTVNGDSNAGTLEGTPSS